MNGRAFPGSRHLLFEVPVVTDTFKGYGLVNMRSLCAKSVSSGCEVVEASCVCSPAIDVRTASIHTYQSGREDSRGRVLLEI